MKRSFSFTEKPILFIIRQLPSIIPGIDKVVTIYFEPEINSIASIATSYDLQEYKISEIRINDIENRLQKLRNDTAPFSWIRKEDIPYEIQSNQKVQLSIFNELDNNILLLRVKSIFDSCNDLLFIYLNQNLSNFGIANSAKPLSTENKTIIGQFLYNAIRTLMTTYSEDNEVFSLLRENNSLVIEKVNGVKNELLLEKEKYRNGVVHLSKNILAELSRENHRIYRLSDDAVSKLKEFNGDLGLLKLILEKASHFAEIVQYESNSDIIELFDFHLVFDLEKPAIKTTSSLIEEGTLEVPIRYSKTLFLLNKLETAATNLKVKNKMLTSANVAGEFPSPVSPSAITDALKKHRPKILHLFKEFPGRWEVIRNEFRPVQNILNPKEERQKNSA